MGGGAKCLWGGGGGVQIIWGANHGAHPPRKSVPAMFKGSAPPSEIFPPTPAFTPTFSLELYNEIYMLMASSFYTININLISSFHINKPLLQLNLVGSLPAKRMEYNQSSDWLEEIRYLTIQ